jgi:hypothetical protein
MKNHGPAQRDRIDDWWNRSVPSPDSMRRALAGMSRKESSKDEALEKAPELRPVSDFVRAVRAVKGLR